jgi:polyphosphate kinase
MAAMYQPINRELSTLAFNLRVLMQATRADVPLLERLRYITIVSSNLDEFFEVRFPDYLEALKAGAVTGPDAEVQDVTRTAHELVAHQYDILNTQVMPALAEAGIRILNHAERSAEQQAWVKRYFDQQVKPMLVPVALDPAHPFPMVANKSLNFILRVTHLTNGQTSRIIIFKVPRVLPRVIALPAELSPVGEQNFVLLTSVIRAHLSELLPSMRVESFSQFRLTRDSDLDVDEDDIANLRHALRTGLTTRHYGQAIRMEVVKSCPEELSNFLLQQFQLPPQALYAVDGPVNLVRLNELIGLVDAADLRFAPFKAGRHPQFRPDERDPFEQLRRHGDVMLHHPFQSFDPVVAFLRRAVNDPQVLAIKQTIYRTGSESVLMDLLMEAVRRGKEVTVVLELKARFDEEANINWAERLERIGAQVVYGMVGLKTHAKMLLVTRREKKRNGSFELRRYAHLSTGNYNPKTASLYTDVGYFTADAELTQDVEEVFLKLSSLAPFDEQRQLLVAPVKLHRSLIAHLERAAQAAREGQPARCVVKANALTDPDLHDALLAAAQAGVEIDLIIRGACILRPGVEGASERIRVRAVVGRFLEHTRVFYVRWGTGDNDEALYLSSADWMSRNMLRRVEVAWPVRDVKLRQRVIDECLVPYLEDSLDAWQLLPDGQYVRTGTDGVSAQRSLMNLLGDL